MNTLALFLTTAVLASPHFRPTWQRSAELNPSTERIQIKEVEEGVFIVRNPKSFEERGERIAVHNGRSVWDQLDEIKAARSEVQYPVAWIWKWRAAGAEWLAPFERWTPPVIAHDPRHERAQLRAIIEPMDPEVVSGSIGSPIWRGKRGVITVGTTVVGFEEVDEPVKLQRVTVQGKLNAGPYLKRCARVPLRIGKVRTKTDGRCRFKVTGRWAGVAAVTVGGAQPAPRRDGDDTVYHVLRPSHIAFTGARRISASADGRPLELDVVQVLDHAHFRE